MLEPLQSVPLKLRRWRNHHLPRYVFIHINKTAGSSIEQALELRFEHKTAIEKRSELRAIRWSRAFKFCFIRNPWDRVLSHYSYRVKTNQTNLGDGHLGFNEWVRIAYGERDPGYYDQPRMFQPQWAWISDENGVCMVDFIGRFERLSQDFERLSCVLGINTSLPHIKPSVHADYRDRYDPDTRQIIADRFAVDLQKFRYTFEQAG